VNGSFGEGSAVQNAKLSDREGSNLAARSRFREWPESAREAVVGVHCGGAIATVSCSILCRLPPCCARTEVITFAEYPLGY
jgi:hypothetical protein